MQLTVAAAGELTLKTCRIEILGRLFYVCFFPREAFAGGCNLKTESDPQHLRQRRRPAGPLRVCASGWRSQRTLRLTHT